MEKEVIQVEIPAGKKAAWVDGFLKLVDAEEEQKKDERPITERVKTFEDACKELGSTQAMFFGHDHLNNISLKYKGIQMCYGNSVDYLAYSNIDKYGSQRGCTVITSHQTGEISIKQENYYQDKYTGIIEKETVSMDDYHDDAGQLVTEPAE